MTSKQPTELEDIAGAIEGLATLMDQRFDQVDKHFERVDKRFDQVDKRFEEADGRMARIESSITAIQQEQHEMRECLIRIDNRLQGVESDIKEIYDRIVVLESRGSTLSLKEKQELEHQIAALFEWAKKVSDQTGIALPRI